MPKTESRLAISDDEMRQRFLDTNAIKNYLSTDDDEDFNKIAYDIITEVFGDYKQNSISGMNGWMAFYLPKRELIYSLLKDMGRLPRSLVEKERIEKENEEYQESIKDRGFLGFIKAAEESDLR
jgi:hypothetical protein